jgi:RNA polymerase sigma-70 factor (ECF subfamily)
MLPSREKLARELERRSDADLIALTAKDPEAFGVFYQRHYQAIVSYLAYYTGNVDVAADLTAEVFADALDGIDRYAPDKGAARAWLFGIARNTLLSSYRRQGTERSARRKLGVSVDVFGDEVWDDVQSRLDANISGLVAGLDGLSPVERDAVIARVIDEQDYAEIAEATGSSEAAVRQRVSRGLAKLARRMRRTER